MYAEAHAVLDATGSLRTPDGASLLMNIGNVKGEQGDFEGALAAYAEARAVRKQGARLAAQHAGLSGRLAPRPGGSR